MPGLLGGDVRACARAALGAVQVDDVRAALGRHAHVVVDARGAQLELDRDLVVGRLADLLDLQREVVRAEPVRVPGRRALVDAGGQRAHLGHLLGDLLAHQVAAQADLAALPDEELAGVGEHQVVRVEPVPALDALVVPLGRQVALGRDHPALARAGRRAGHRGALGERHLGLDRERAEAHARDVDRDVELDRLLREARAEDRLRLALLAVALDHEARQRAGHEHQLIPVRDRLEHREAAHAVAPELGLHVDVVDDLRREDLAVAEDVRACCWWSRLPWLTPSLRERACARTARGCRSCRASCRTRTCRSSVGCRGRRCGTCARCTRCRRPSTRPGRSRCRAP